MGDLCTACMCTGRNLYYIGETGFYHLYSQILNEIQVYDSSPFYIRVCWECVAQLRKWLKFKEQAKRSYTQLQYAQQNNLEQLASPARLAVCQAFSYSCPEPHIKAEADEPLCCPLDGDGHVKVEDTHCEPESFVHNLDLEPKKRRAKKVEKQPVKEKSKKKIKPKTEKIPIKKKVKVKKKRSPSPASLHDDHLDAEELDIQDDDVKDQIIDGKEIKEENVPLVKEVKTKPKTEKIPIKKKVKVKKKRSPSPASLHDDHLDAEDLDIQDDDVTDKIIDVKEIKEEKVPLVKERKRLNGEVKPVKAAPPKEALPERPHCEECGKNFSSRKTYRYHLNVLHKGQNRYPCPRCGKVYQWKSNLGRHLRSHKARDSGELYCETCDKRFASVATYRQHLRVSRRHVPESEFSFMCNECGKKFVNKTRLRDHIDWEHLQKIKFRCQLCNKPFKCHTSLYVHLQNVHRNKEKKDNLCHVCGKSYQNAAKLKYHIVAMHTSETPYQCQQCTAAFGWYSSLYRHVREVHYKMKLQPKKSKKSKKTDILPSLLPIQMVLPPMHQPGPP